MAFVVSPLHSSAQELTGWTIIHSSRAFDYLVSDSVVREGIPGDSTEIVRMFVAQMLSRKLDSVRAEMAADPRSMAADPHYASSTHVIEVRCWNGLLRRGTSTDFADDGSVLGERVDADRWREPRDFEEPSAMEAVVRWACGQAGG
jgi:hypothetical protein